MGLHPVIGVEKMGFSIPSKFACKFRHEVTPINHLLMNYLRGWLMWERLRPILTRLEGTSRVYWNRLLWRGLLRNRLLRGLLWCRLVRQLIWRLIRMCIWRTSGGIVVIVVIVNVLIRLVSIAICIIIGICRGWHDRTFHHLKLVQNSLTLFCCILQIVV